MIFFLFFFPGKRIWVGLGWLGNLNHLGCRGLFYSCIHTVEFLLPISLFSSLPLPLSPIVDQASPSAPPSPNNSPPPPGIFSCLFPPFFFLSITGKVKSGEIEACVIRTMDAAGGCACFHLCICMCCSGGDLDGKRDRGGKFYFISFFKKIYPLYA